MSARTEKPRVDPAVLEPNYNKAMKYFNAGNFDKAIEVFLEVWRLDPDFHDVAALLSKAYLLLGMTAYSDGDYTEAIRLWEKVLAIDPGNSKARRYLTRVRKEVSELTEVRN